MITEIQLAEMIKKVKAETKQRKFTQAIELIINFKDIDVKKGFALNEVVELPKTNSPATVCVMATGDMSLKAKKANADAVIGTDELEKFATSPPLAFIMILFLARRTFSLNGDMLVNMNIHCSLSSPIKSLIPGMSDFSRAFFATLSLMLTNSTSSLRIFLKGSICVERTLYILIKARTLYFFGSSCNC